METNENNDKDERPRESRAEQSRLRFGSAMLTYERLR